jgi:inorganic pyrophosphatase
MKRYRLTDSAITKWVKLLGWGNADEAKQLITDAIERARANAVGGD